MADRPLRELRALFVDPELGEYGLGRVAALVPDAECWPAASVHSMRAITQAAATLDELLDARIATELVVGQGAGVTVAVQLLAAGVARRVLLIDPIDYLTHDAGFEQVFRIDCPLPGPAPTTSASTAEERAAVQANIDRITTAIAALRAGRVTEFYDWVANGCSDRGEIRAAFRAALAAADAARQPYDEGLVGPVGAGWAALDWLATLRGLPANAVEIWYSRWPPGARLVMTAGYLRRELPGVKVKLCDWDRYGFLVAPERWARALRVRSVANTTNRWVR